VFVVRFQSRSLLMVEEVAVEVKLKRLQSKLIRRRRRVKRRRKK